MKLAGTNGSYVSYHIIIRMVEMDIVFLIKLEEQCWDSSSPGFFLPNQSIYAHVISLPQGSGLRCWTPGQPGGFQDAWSKVFNFPQGCGKLVRFVSV